MKIRIEVSAEVYARLCQVIRVAENAISLRASEVWPDKYPEQGWNRPPYDPKVVLVSVTRGKTWESDPSTLEIDLEIKERVEAHHFFSGSSVRADLKGGPFDVPRAKIQAIMDVLGVFPELANYQGLRQRREKANRIQGFLMAFVTQDPFSVRTETCLRNAQLLTINQVVRKSEQELLRIPNFGRRCLTEVKEILAKEGLRPGMTEEEIENLIRVE